MKKLLLGFVIFTSFSQVFAYDSDNKNQISLDTGNKILTIACSSEALISSIKELTRGYGTDNMRDNIVLDAFMDRNGLISIERKRDYNGTMVNADLKIQPNSGCLLTKYDKV